MLYATNTMKNFKVKLPALPRGASVVKPSGTAPTRSAGACAA